jgi:hypothetical protein
VVEELASDPRLVALRRSLADARAAGIAFADAWEPAVAEALLDASKFERDLYLGALSGTRDSWEAAYCWARPPSRVERAATELETFAADAELRALAYEPVL